MLKCWEIGMKRSRLDGVWLNWHRRRHTDEHGGLTFFAVLDSQNCTIFLLSRFVLSEFLVCCATCCIVQASETAWVTHSSTLLFVCHTPYLLTLAYFGRDDIPCPPNLQANWLTTYGIFRWAVVEIQNIIILQMNTVTKVAAASLSRRWPPYYLIVPRYHQTNFRHFL